MPKNTTCLDIVISFIVCLAFLVVILVFVPLCFLPFLRGLLESNSILKCRSAAVVFGPHAVVSTYHSIWGCNIVTSALAPDCSKGTATRP